MDEFSCSQRPCISIFINWLGILTNLNKLKHVHLTSTTPPYGTQLP